MPLPFAALGAGLAGAGGTAAAGGGIAATLGSLAAHPLWGSLMSITGTRMLEDVVGGQSAYEKAAQQQMQAGLSILPELQRAAAGQPTAASRNIIRQVRQEGTRQQQAYATGARQAGLVGQTPGGSTPYRVQQGRIQSDVRQIMGQQLGQAQQQAQATLAGMITPGIQAAERQGIYANQSQEMVMSSLGRFMQHYNANRNNPQYAEVMDLIKQFVRQSFEPTAGTTQQTYTVPINNRDFTPVQPIPQGETIPLYDDYIG